MATRERERYLASQRNQANMRAVETLLEREAITVIDTGRELERQELGGFLRTVVPSLVDRYGNINATAALQYYDQQREAWEKANPALVRQLSRDARRGQQTRFASAATRGAIYRATRPEFNPVDITDPIIGFSMARFTEDGFGAMRDQVVSAMTRAVAAYNRDTVLYNSALDPGVITVQRVAEPKACAFCRLMAFSSTRSAAGQPLDVRTTQYAVDFHDRCRCSIETIYQGDSPIRPDYYDDFEAEYVEASQSSGTSNAKTLLKTWRDNTGAQ